MAAGRVCYFRRRTGSGKQKACTETGGIDPVIERESMVRSHRQLPQLQSLVYFESAARHLNFTSAAEELGTTQPAVSHRIRNMEEHLGISLFMRQHRGVKLTAEGLRLYQTVRESLEALRITTAEVRIQDEQRTLTLATDFGFAKLWLLPRIHELRRAVPNVQLRILTSQEEIDPRKDEVDLSVLFNNAPTAGDVSLLFREKVVPVCSPGLLRQQRAVRNVGELAELPLLHLEQANPKRWMNWNEWFAAQGIAPPAASAHLIFNDYSLIIQAAIAGHGVALGWAPLVDDLLDRGELAIAYDRPVQTARGYFLVTPRPGQLVGPRAKVRDWIICECAKNSYRPFLGASHGEQLAAA